MAADELRVRDAQLEARDWPLLDSALTVSEAPGGVAIEVRMGVTEPGCMMGASFELERERAHE